MIKRRGGVKLAYWLVGSIVVEGTGIKVQAAESTKAARG
jgi:hypothetical protein